MGRRDQADPSLTTQEARRILRTAGDMNDPVRSMFTLPGMTFGSGDLDPPVVRGAGPADNLYLLDGVPVPTLFHKLGDSIANPHTIRALRLEGAAVPLPYGQAVGGVIDVTLREPADAEWRAVADLSQLKTGVLIEGPISDRIAAYAGYRRNLTHLFLTNLETGNETLLFRMPESSDYTAKAILRLADLSMAVSAFGAWDERREVPRRGVSPEVGLTERQRLDGQSLHLTLPTNQGIRATATVAHTRFADTESRGDGTQVGQVLNSWTLRSLVDAPVGWGMVSGGVNATIDRGQLTATGALQICDLLDRACAIARPEAGGTRSGTFSLVEGFAGAQLPVHAGIQLDVGARLVRDTTLSETYLEPRAGVFFQLGETLDLYIHGGLQHQRPELLRLLLLHHRRQELDGQRSWQGLAGLKFDLADGWAFRAEGWYKDFRATDLIGAVDSMSFTGEAQGIDLEVTKSAGLLTGTLALSRNWTERRLQPSGAVVPFRYDIPWTGTFAANWTVGGGWSIGAKWRVQSGVRFTPVASTENIDPFSERAPYYSRLDIGLEWAFSLDFGTATARLDFLNALGRKNIAERHVRFAMSSSGELLTARSEEYGVPRFIGFGLSVAF